jgi:hypothetical protein
MAAKNSQKKKNGQPRNQMVVRLSAPKKKKRTSNRIGRRRNQILGQHLAEELACSWADPFKCSACIPDGTYGTGCFSVKSENILGTGAGGSTCLFAQTISPNASYYVDTGNTTAVPIVAGNWTQSPQILTFISLYGKYRPVSAGFRASYVGNTQTDGGVLIYGLVAGDTPVNVFNGRTLAQAQDVFLKYQINPIRNGCQVKWLPQDDHDCGEFITTVTTPVPVANGFDTPYIICIAYGVNAATASLLHVESVVNYEGQYSSQTFMPGGLSAQQKEAEPGWFEKAKNMVRTVEQISSFVPSLAQAASNVAPIALGYMGNGILAPGRMGRTGMPRLQYR